MGGVHLEDPLVWQEVVKAHRRCERTQLRLWQILEPLDSLRKCSEALIEMVSACSAMAGAKMRWRREEGGGGGGGVHVHINMIEH